MVRSLLAILFLVSLSSRSGAQAIQPLDLAESLYKAGSYNEAITEYKRHLFFREDDRTPEIYHRIGLCFRNLGDWTNAESMTKMAIELQGDDSLRSAYYMDLVIIYMAAGNYPAAELRLLKLVSFADQPTIRRRASFFRMVNFIYQKKWEACREALNTGSALNEPAATAILMAMLEKYMKSRKSPSTAKWLSTFVPGLGQLYAGHPWSAINAGAINGFLGYNLFNQIRIGAPVSDIGYWVFVFERFWSGNRNRAALLVNQDRIDRDARLRREMLETVGSFIK